MREESVRARRETAMSARRPGGVTLLAVLIMIGGVAQVIGGVLLILGHQNATVLRETGRSGDFLLSGGIAAIVVGLLYVLVSLGLSNGKGLARFLVGLLSLISVAGGIWAAGTQHGTLFSRGLASAIVGFIILVLLYSPKANTFFRMN
jgi:hypothetical protein